MSLFRDLLIDKKRRRYYTEVEYLESTGTQYIDTGVYPADMTYVEAEAQYTQVNKRQTLLGCYITNSNYNTFAGTNVQSNYANFFAQWSPGTYSGPVASDTNKHFFSFDKPTKVFTVDNSTTTLDGTTSNVSGQTLYMFATHSGSTIDRQANAKIYYLKIKNGDTLVRDFIPVLGWDGKGYMYDKVSRQLFGNAGTGDFVLGRQIHYVEYLESTGEQYIDTGYIGSDTSGFSVDIMPLQNADRYFIGSRPRITTADRWLAGSNAGPQVYIGWNVNHSVNWTLNNIHSVQNNFMNSRTKVLDGTVVSQITTTLLSQGTRTAYLFSANDANISRIDTCRIYKAQISEGSSLVRDFNPAIDENDNYFMFDKVSHTCYNNAGSGSFIGPTVQKDENGKIIEPRYE